jgi:hypothetical protein
MPKLTLRDLFAVVTIVAIMVAWWVDHGRLATENVRVRSENYVLKQNEARLEADVRNLGIRAVTAEAKAFVEREQRRLVAPP